jgi:dihydropteroate synthase
MEILSLDHARRELERIGVHPQGIAIMAPKAVFRVLKIHSLSPYQANVLKQEMLALGADAATAQGCIDCSCKESDVILLGTLCHFEKLSEKLLRQPPSFHDLAKRIRDLALSQLMSRYPQWRIGHQMIALGPSPLIMGIVNVTPDSFSDGGKYYEPDCAAEHALRLAREGADIIDIGGESSRPGSDPVSVEEEKTRVLPVLERLLRKISVPVSIDTCKSEVADAALERGAAIVNDITALRGDSRMASLCADKGAGVVLMHMKGDPRTMQIEPGYEDVVEEVSLFFEERIRMAEAAGIDRQSIVLDPGIGFGKNLGHNLSLLRSLPLFLERHTRPILVGISRKRFIGELTGEPVEDRLSGTIGAVVASALKGASILRVHDVAQCRAALRVAEAIHSLH